MNLGANISFLRKQKKLTQEQLADQMRVSRQTVSRWESDEVIPELERLVELCGLFSCKLDTLVCENLSGQQAIYSEVKVVPVAAFRFAGCVVISADPEQDAQAHMRAWAEAGGLKAACPDYRLIGWDFPFVSQEQRNRFGLHGYAAACVLPDDFVTDHPGAVIAENKAADYAKITIRDPFVRPFERIPNAYKRIMDFLKMNSFKDRKAENLISCYEYEYMNDGVTYMDVYVSVNEVTKTDAFTILG